ncbi:MAG: TetR/AcrR family transcriptional regulator [Ectothiorhodospiraceae bacterium]
MGRPASYDRNEVLQRAVALFWEQGYHATSVKDLEAAVDMRPGSLYAAFGSKAGLFGAALEAYADASEQRLRDILAAAPGVVAGIRAYLEAVAATATGVEASGPRACMIVKTVLEVSGREPGLAEQANRHLERLEGVLAEAVGRGQANGEIDTDADATRLARLIQAQVTGLRAYAQRSVSEADVRALAADMAAVLDAHLTPSLTSQAESL